jgi:hypothetical protein
MIKIEFYLVYCIITINMMFLTFVVFTTIAAKDTIPSEGGVYAAEGGFMFNASLNICAVDEMVVNPLHEEPGYTSQEVAELWKIYYVCVMIAVAIILYKSANAFLQKYSIDEDEQSTILYITGMNGDEDGRLTLEYSKSILSPEVMTNTIKAVCNSDNVDMASVNKEVFDFAITLLEMLPVGRPNIPIPPEKIGKNTFNPISGNKDEDNFILETVVPGWFELYSCGKIETLLAEMVTYYEAQPGFHEACAWQIAMIVCQDLTTIVYWKEVNEQIAEQKKIASTKVPITPNENIRCVAEDDGKVPHGFQCFKDANPFDHLNITAVFIKKVLAKCFNLLERPDLLHNECRENVDNEFGNGAYDAVKAPRMTVVMSSKIIIVSYHFSAPSSKSGFASNQVKIVASVIRAQFKYLTWEFPDVKIIYGGDSNLATEKDSVHLSELLEQDGLFVGNDSKSPSGISQTECRPTGRNTIASLQRLKWGVPVYAAKMLFISNFKRNLIVAVADGVKHGTPGTVIPYDHAQIFAKVLMT